MAIKDPPIKKPKLTILDAPNILIVVVEIVVIFWGFGNLVMFHWLGFNFLASSINVLLRFAIIYYINMIAIEFVAFQSSKPDKNYRNILIGTFFLICLLYLPITFPSVTVFQLVHKYTIYYILPFLLVVLITFIIIIQTKIDFFTATLINFFFLLFWKYNVHYFIFF